MNDVLLITSMPYHAGIDLGLAYLGGALRRAGYDVALREAVSTIEPPADLAAWAAARSPRVVGFKVWTPNLPAVRRYLTAIREAVPGAAIVVGGPHVTGVGDRVFRDLPGADFAVVGEAETSLPLLVREIARGGRPRESVLARIPGLVRARDGAVSANPPHFVEELDDLADPAWDLCDFDLYRGITGGSYKVLRFNWIHVQATRGCPNHCAYCLVDRLAGHRLRRHSASRVAGQIETLARRYGVGSFSFADDNLTMDRALAEGIFTRMRDLRLPVAWNCHSNGLQLGTLDDAQVRLMEQAGCTGVTLGIESGSPRLLKRMGRGWYTIEDVERAIAIIRGASRMEISAFFLIGYPDETDADLIETIRLIRRIDLDTIAVNAFTPWPGSPASRRLEREGRYPPFTDETFWYERITMPTDHVPVWRLNLYHLGCFSAFFSRPDRLARHVRRWGVRNFLTEVGLVLADKVSHSERGHVGRIHASRLRRRGAAGGA